MLFDLKSGKRRRVVQIVFGFLAFLFFISFVGFGVGSDVTGGIFDAIGLGGGGSSSSDPQYEDQIEDSEATLETDPKNQNALLNLARYHYLSATQSGITTDTQTGQVSITEDAHSELEDAVQAWDDYLATKPEKPNTSVASNAAQAFVYLGDASGAAQAQRIVADAQPSAAGYATLAQYLYFDAKFEAGDEAAAQAVKEAEPSQRKGLEKSLASLRDQVEQQQKQIEKQAKKGGSEAAQQELENPFGGLGGSTAPVSPSP